MSANPTIIPINDEAVKALEQRGITAEVIDRIGVGSVQKTKKNDGREWIGFRHENGNGEPDHIACRTITGSKQFFQSSGTRRRLWNWQCIRDEHQAAQPLIITEGHIDAMTLCTAGFDRVVSVPDGAPSKPVGSNGKEKYRYLDEIGLDQVREIILCVDNDQGGLALMEDLAYRLGKPRCKFVRYPSGCKDVNDVLRDHGAEGVHRLIGGASYFEFEDVYTWRQLPPEPKPVLVDCGIQGMRRLWQFERGRLGVLVGRPGNGKSALITDIICNFAHNHDWVIAICSLEDRARGTLGRRLMRWYLRADPDYVSAEKYAEAEAWIDRHFVFITPGGKSTRTVHWYLDCAEVAVRRHNASLVSLDPWNKLNHMERPEGVSVTEYVGVMTTEIRMHALQHNYYSLVAVHPPKQTGDFEKRIPTGYDCADSAHWYNSADNGIGILRGENGTTISCWKAKEEHIGDQLMHGKAGEVMTFTFDQISQRFLAAPEQLEAALTGRAA